MSSQSKSKYSAGLGGQKDGSRSRQPSSYVTLVSNTATDKKAERNHPKPTSVPSSSSTKSEIYDNKEFCSGADSKDISKLLLNIKLLKEGLRNAAVMGQAQFDAELRECFHTSKESLPNEVVESIWLVKRAISELHVMENRRKQNIGNASSGSAAVAAEFSLAGQLTEVRAQLATEKDARESAESKVDELMHRWKDEKNKLEEHSRVTMEQAVAEARREGEVGAERLAERLKRSETKCSQLETKLKESEMHLQEALKKVQTNGSNIEKVSTWSSDSNASKDKRMMHLERQVATFRRKESELTSSNINLQAKVDRLSKELRGTRPAPNSRGKMAELSARVDELDALLTKAHLQLQESKDMQHELNSEVGSLSVARAERDTLILELRECISRHESKVGMLEQELQEVQVLLNQTNGEKDDLHHELDKLKVNTEQMKGKYEHRLEQVSRDAEIELQAGQRMKAEMNDVITSLKQDQDKFCSQVQSLKKQVADAKKEVERVSEEYEEAMRQIEDENMEQLSKARKHCDCLRAEKLKLEDDQERMTARMAELTSSLKESQHARLELQVRVHESSVEFDKLRSELLSMQDELSSEQAARKDACAQALELRDQNEVLRQLENQLQSVLQGSTLDSDSLVKVQEKLEKLGKFDQEILVKNEKIERLKKEVSDLKSTLRKATEGEQAVNPALIAAEERAVNAAATLSSFRASAAAQKASFEKRIGMLEESLRSGERREAELNKQLSVTRKNLSRKSSRSENILMTPPRSPPPPSLVSPGQDSENVVNNVERKESSGATKVASATAYSEEGQRGKHPDSPKAGTQRLYQGMTSTPYSQDERSSMNPLLSPPAHDSEKSKEGSASVEELRKVLELQQKQIERLEQSQSAAAALAANTVTTSQTTVDALPTTSEQTKTEHTPTQTLTRRSSRTPETPVYLHDTLTSEDTSPPKTITHATHVSNACASLWSGIGLYCVKKKCSIQQVWSVEFDRARTSRNTLSQFSSGIGRCGFRASSSEASAVFREMHDEGKKRRAEEDAAQIKAEKNQSTVARSHGGGVMLEGTIGCDDFVDAAGRWLKLCLTEPELATLGLGEVEETRKLDILDDLNEECTFSPKLNKNTSFRSRPSFKVVRSSSDASTTAPTTLNRSSSYSNVATSSVRKKTPNRTASPHKSSSRNSFSGGKRADKSKDKNTFDLPEALSHIVGQDKLKDQLLAFEKGIELQARRKELGIECDGAWPPHMMFCGNPGTGKTTIARLVGLVLKKLGVLKKGHLVEVQRSDLVAGAIGQTALKTREKINQARGGVLFVDEAYTLAPGGGAETKDFGREAINEMMSVMNEGDPVVIFAGYKKEMEAFVQSNAGLFRRIDVRYDFEDYSTMELAAILRGEVSGAGFYLEDSISDAVIASLLEKYTQPKLRNAMGGGLSRQWFRKARGKLDAELSLDASPQEMCTLSVSHLIAGLADISSLPSD